MRRYRQLLNALSAEHPSPNLKQLPTVFAFLVSLVLLASVNGIQVTNAPFLVGGIAGIAVA
ncbi:MAG: hypothetical protein JWP75_2685, partial [Frondihabitans sp.]|nr:hypothetical protein [Frondihabitans sp.]